MLPTLLLMLGTTPFRFGTWADGSPAWSALERPDSGECLHTVKELITTEGGDEMESGGRGRFRDRDDTDEKHESRCCCFLLRRLKKREKLLFR